MGYLFGKSGANIEEIDKFDGTNMCNLCTSIPNKACLPTGMTCGDINTEEAIIAKLNELYGSDPDKQDKLDELEKEFIRKSKNFANENNSMKDKYNYLIGACNSYCNMFNIE